MEKIGEKPILVIGQYGEVTFHGESISHLSQVVTLAVDRYQGLGKVLEFVSKASDLAMRFARLDHAATEGKNTEAEMLLWEGMMREGVVEYVKGCEILAEQLGVPDTVAPKE